MRSLAGQFAAAHERIFSSRVSWVHSRIIAGCLFAKAHRVLALDKGRQMA